MVRYQIFGLRPLVGLAILIFPFHLSSQNVGIGTNSPGYPLHIVTSNSAPLSIDGGANMYVRMLENGIYRGYYGSYSGVAQDVDFGTGSGNATGKLHLTIQGFPMLTVAPGGNVGIGTQVPGEKLTVNGGNIELLSSDKGVMLNSADRAMITRGFDPFISGIHVGLGRWGLFMEPSRLTLGIPAISGKAVEFASFNTNSTRNTLMTIDNNGEVQRPATSAADLLPIAYANISHTGSILSGTGNVGVDIIQAGNVYDISVTGKTLTQSGTVFFLTITNDGQGTVQHHGFFTGGKIRVVLIRSSGTYLRDFSILVYQP